MRSESCPEAKHKRRVNIEAGKSVSHANIIEQQLDDSVNEKLITMIRNDEKEEEKVEQDETDEEEDESDDQNVGGSQDRTAASITAQYGHGNIFEDWVVVNYEGSKFPGVVKKVESDGVDVSVMQKNSGIGWRWPLKNDQILYSYADVLSKLPATSVLPFNSCGIYTVDSQVLADWGQ